MTDHLDDTTDGFRVHVIDVGQGDSILLEGREETMLIDSGPRSDHGKQVLDYLNKHDINHLDHLVATHYDADHIGGHAAVVKEFGPDEISEVHGPSMEGVKHSDSNTMTRYQEALAETGLEVNKLQEGDDLNPDDIDIAVLNPSPEIDSENRNENSLVIQATYGEQNVLLAGDINRDTESYLVDTYPEQLSRVDVLKASHHGADNGTGVELLMTCDPETVCFLHGENNQHDHPTRKTLSRTHVTNTEAVSNVVHGSTTFALDGEETIDIEHEREVATRDVADVTAMIHFARAHGRDQLDPSEGIDRAILPETTPSWADEADIINTEETTETTEESTEAQRQDRAWVFGQSGENAADAQAQATSTSNNKNEGL